MSMERPDAMKNPHEPLWIGEQKPDAVQDDGGQVLLSVEDPRWPLYVKLTKAGEAAKRDWHANPRRKKYPRLVTKAWMTAPGKEALYLNLYGAPAPTKEIVTVVVSVTPEGIVTWDYKEGSEWQSPKLQARYGRRLEGAMKSALDSLSPGGYYSGAWRFEPSQLALPAELSSATGPKRRRSKALYAGIDWRLTEKRLTVDGVKRTTYVALTVTGENPSHRKTKTFPLSFYELSEAARMALIEEWLPVLRERLVKEDGTPLRVHVGGRVNIPAPTTREPTELELLREENARLRAQAQASVVSTPFSVTEVIRQKIAEQRETMEREAAKLRSLESALDAVKG